MGRAGNIARTTFTGTQGHKMKSLVSIGLLAVFVSGVMTTAAAAGAPKNDRHIGYYYPAPANIERFVARVDALPEANRRRRVAFVISVVSDMMARPYPPSLSIFAKGTEAQKLIIVSNVPGRLDTIYRVRALLASLTSSARTTSIFRELNAEDRYTFLDLIKLLGFELVTVSDGAAFTHQIVLE